MYIHINNLQSYKHIALIKTLIVYNNAFKIFSRKYLLDRFRLLFCLSQILVLSDKMSELFDLSEINDLY